MSPVGDAAVLGRAKSTAPIVGIAARPGGQGYVLAAADGGVFTFGRAKFFGSMGGIQLQRPVVGVAYSPTGLGYYLVAADGGIFTFGDAKFRGSTGSLHLRAPIVGMAVTRTGRGYWLVAADGGIFTFGDATFRGSAASQGVSAPIVGMAVTHSDRGYWLAGRDAAVYRFGDAPLLARHDVTQHAYPPTVAIAASPTGRGYLLMSDLGDVAAFGDAAGCLVSERFSGGGQTPRTHVGIAIPSDPATVRRLIAGSCGSVSNVFRLASPWRIEMTPAPRRGNFFQGCYAWIYRGTDQWSGPGVRPLWGGGGGYAGRIEIRSTQMAGATSFRLLSSASCIAVARPGSGGSQPLPFVILGVPGDTLPFTSASPITIDSSTLDHGSCSIYVFANSDGHRIKRRVSALPHLHIVVPPGSYFLNTSVACRTTVK